MCYIALVEKLIFKIVYGAMPTNCTSSSKKKNRLLVQVFCWLWP